MYIWICIQYNIDWMVDSYGASPIERAEFIHHNSDDKTGLQSKHST